MPHQRQPVARPAERLGQLAWQAEREIECAEPWPGLAQQGLEGREVDERIDALEPHARAVVEPTSRHRDRFRATRRAGEVDAEQLHQAHCGGGTIAGVLSNALHRRRHWWIAALAVVAVAVVLAMLLRVAASQLQQRIAGALGPRATLDATALAWNGVELRGLRIAAARGWPASDELRASRVLVVPDLRSLWAVALGGPWRVRRIEIDGGYVSLHRTRDGTLRVLPSLLGKPASGDAPAVVIGELRLDGAALDFHDSSVRPGSTHRLRLDPLDATVGPLHLPALDVAVAIDIAAVLKGPRHDGRLELRGEVVPSTRDAKLEARARGVDLVALQPYLLRINDSGVKTGRLDLKLDATVRRMRLNAPGNVTLTDLELAAGSGVLGTLAGVPRQAVLAAMRRDGRIEVRFTLDGRLDDPAFSINESFATRVASGLAETLGVSVGGVVEGVGSVIKGLLGR